MPVSKGGCGPLVSFSHSAADRHSVRGCGHHQSPARGDVRGARVASLPEAMAQVATRAWTMPPVGARQDLSRVSGAARRQLWRDQTQMPRHRVVCARVTRAWTACAWTTATGETPVYLNSDVRGKHVVVVGLGYARVGTTKHGSFKMHKHADVHALSFHHTFFARETIAVTNSKTHPVFPRPISALAASPAARPRVSRSSSARTWLALTLTRSARGWRTTRQF
jgi:hypothetical protein